MLEVRLRLQLQFTVTVMFLVVQLYVCDFGYDFGYSSEYDKFRVQVYDNIHSSREQLLLLQ